MIINELVTEKAVKRALTPPNSFFISLQNDIVYQMRYHELQQNQGRNLI